ncbi:MAG: NAD(P)H-dependent oxidoreductase [Patescibacteria group bacterium]
MSFLENLAWRFATKKFDSGKSVSKENLNKILEAVRMAPSAYGLQPYHIFVIKDPELRKKLKSESFLQSQVTDASVLLVFCARTDLGQVIDEYIELVSGGKLLAKTKLLPFKIVMQTDLGRKKGEAALTWATKSTGVALGFGLAACAELKIDSCPMEGFSVRGVSRVLNLPSHLIPVAYLAVGYRLEEPTRPKVRFSETELFSRR